MAQDRQNYRPEIDGLRAVAVLAVMLYHAGVPWLAGGWLGVDVFFVISGYLITGIIVRQETAGRFSLRGFWARRIRRIMPSLLVVMALSTLAALLVMLPDQLQNFGQSLVATGLMANNLLLLLTGGYWAGPNVFKPLYHSWSLGVEEQFYLLLPPLMLWSLRRRGIRGLAWLLLVASGASLALALWWSLSSDPRTPYLLLPARLWQLGAGGLVALAQLRGPVAWGRRSCLALSWLAMMLAPMLAMGPHDLATPQWMLPAVGGAALFLLVGRGDGGAGRLLAGRGPVAVGLVSYSAYLLHQPVFAFARLLSWRDPGPAVLAALLPPVLLAAWALWRWVEQPARDRARWTDRRVIGLCAAVLAVLLAAGLALHVSRGLVARWPELRRDDGSPGADTIAYVERVRGWPAARLNPAQAARQVLFIGDSRARDAANMAVESGALTADRIGYLELTICSDATRAALRPHFLRAATAVIAAVPSPVPLPCEAALVRDLRQAGVSQVVVIGPKQFGWNINRAMLVPRDQRPQLRVPTYPAEIPAINRQARQVFGAAYVDVIALVGDGAGRMPVFTPQGRLISQDRLHLTPAGARWLGTIVFAQPQLAHLRAGGAPEPAR